MIMFGSFLPSLWSSTNHSLLGSKEPTLLCNHYLFIGRSQRDKQFARWQVRRSTNVPNERVTRSKLCSPNSSNRLSCARPDCDDCGTLLSSSTWQPQPKT